MGYHIPYWFHLDNSDQIENTFLVNSKLVDRINPKFPYERPSFFPRQAIAKIRFILNSRYTWDASCRVWFYLNNFMI